jgi:hypothetical protein
MASAPIETYRECAGAVKVIACIEDPVVIEKILTHLNGKATSAATGLLPEKFAGERSPASSGFAKVGRIEQFQTYESKVMIKPNITFTQSFRFIAAG